MLTDRWCQLCLPGTDSKVEFKISIRNTKNRSTANHPLTTQSITNLTTAHPQPHQPTLARNYSNHGTEII